jgi:hypothetical protein
MSEDSSLPGMGSPPHGPPPVPTRHEPPQIPEGHEPPPAPAFHEPPIPQIPERPRVLQTHKPAPIPANRQPPPIPKSFPRAIVNRRSSNASGDAIGQSEVKIVVSKTNIHASVFLSWLGFSLVLISIPIALLGAFWPGLRSPFWLTVLILSFVAICLEKFASSRPNVSADLVRLSLRLGYGFLLISLVGLVAAAFRASVYISHVVAWVAQAIHGVADSWHESNSIMAWFLHKADAIMQFFASQTATAANASPSPSPTPTPVP